MTDLETQKTIGKIKVVACFGLALIGGMAYKGAQFANAQEKLVQKQLKQYDVPTGSTEVAQYNLYLLKKIELFSAKNNIEPTAKEILQLMTEQRDSWITTFPHNPDNWSAKQFMLYNYATNMINVWAKENNLDKKTVTAHRTNATYAQVLNNNAYQR